MLNIYQGKSHLLNFTKTIKKCSRNSFDRLYETQVKKIIKVQCMMRAFLAKRNVADKLRRFRQESCELRPQ